MQACLPGTVDIVNIVIDIVRKVGSSKAIWQQGSLGQENPIMLINKKLPNYRLQLSQSKIANFSISKSTKLPNFYHGQTEQFAFGQYSEWQFVEVKLGTPGPWEKSKCKLLVQKLAISKG